MQKPTPRDMFAKWWRQVGFWGITLNTIAGFPLIACIVLFTDKDPTPVIIAFGSILTAWLACAGIRQWGKNSGGEVSHPTTSKINL